MTSAKAKFRILKGSTVHGPLTRQQVTFLMTQGRVGKSDLISVREGPWLPLQEVLLEVDEPPPVSEIDLRGLAIDHEEVGSPQPEEREEWYYASRGERAGPVTQSQLRSLLQDGRINSKTLVWNPGKEQWLPVSSSGLVPLPRPTLPEDQSERRTACADFLKAACQLFLFAAALSGIGGALADFFTPFFPFNLTFCVGSAGVTIVLLLLFVVFRGHGLGLASFCLLCAAVGFGLWWGLAEYKGSHKRGFLAAHSRPVADLQTSWFPGIDLKEESPSPSPESEPHASPATVGPVPRLFVLPDAAASFPSPFPSLATHVSMERACLYAFEMGDLNQNADLGRNLFLQQLVSPLAGSKENDNPHPQEQVDRDHSLVLEKGTGLQVLKTDIQTMTGDSPKAYAVQFVRVCSGRYRGKEGWITDRLIRRNQ